jgi:hypothetical protein
MNTYLVTCPDVGCRGHIPLWLSHLGCPWCGRTLVAHVDEV